MYETRINNHVKKNILIVRILVTDTFLVHFEYK